MSALGASCLRLLLLTRARLPAVACGSEDGSCRLFDSKSGSLVRCFSGHRSALTALRCVPGKLLSAHVDGCMSVWSTADLRQESAFGGDRDEGSDDSRSDSSNVTEAVRILEKHLRHR